MLTRSQRARQIARSIALKTFGRHWDLATILNDVDSTAFELELTAPPNVTAGSIGFMAVRRVRVGRHFKESIRSIHTGRFDRRSPRPAISQDHDLDIEEDLVCPNADPAELACFIVDYEEWLARLDKRKRKVAKLLASGETTHNAAKQFGVSDGRISQMRRELQQNWEAFQGQN